MDKKQWKCPNCKRVRHYNPNIIYKRCPCGTPMEVVEDEVS